MGQVTHNFFVNHTCDASDAREALEAIIDTHGIGVVLDMIGGICHDKSEHITQDKRLAIAWKRLGVTVHKAEVSARILLGRLANGR